MLSVVSIRRSSLLLGSVVIALVIGAVSASAAGGGSTIGIGFVPAKVSKSELARIPEFGKEQLTGLSRVEPDICDSLTVTVAERATPLPQDRGGLGVHPAQWEVHDLKPGSSYRKCITIENQNPSTSDYQLTTVELVGSPDPAIGTQLEVNPVAAGRWIRLAATKVTLRAGETAQVPYAVDVPLDTPKGSLVGGIRVTQTSTASGASTTVASSVVHRFYVTFPGGTQRKLKVDDVKSPKLLSKTKGDVAYHASFIVRNASQTLDTYDTKLSVSGFGRKVGSDATEPNVLLPNGSGSVDLVWRDLPFIGWYSPHATVRSRTGLVEVDLPHVLILPPRPYVIAIIVAILVPIIWAVVSWRRRRADWLQYLEEEDDQGQGEEWDEFA